MRRFIPLMKGSVKNDHPGKPAEEIKYYREDCPMPIMDILWSGTLAMIVQLLEKKHSKKLPAVIELRELRAKGTQS